MPVEANPNCVIDVAINEGPPPRDESDYFGRRVELMMAAVEGVVGTFEESFSLDAPRGFSKPKFPVSR